MTGTRGTEGREHLFMILEPGFQFINEEFYADAVTGEQLDALLADAWRHFGTHFFRYNLGVYEDEIRLVLPLRIRLANFKLSKNQRRVLRRNADLTTEIRPIEISDETHALFERHKRRFKRDAPATVFDFLSHDPAAIPVTGLEVNVRSEGELAAVSFFGLGYVSISSIYGIFDPDALSRSLGIFTMLKEIEYAIGQGKQFYYHGYAYSGVSFYDYKKRFSGLENSDWKGSWSEFQPTS